MVLSPLGLLVENLLSGTRLSRQGFIDALEFLANNSFNLFGNLEFFGECIEAIARTCVECSEETSSLLVFSALGKRLKHHWVSERGMNFERLLEFFVLLPLLQLLALPLPHQPYGEGDDDSRNETENERANIEGDVHDSSVVELHPTRRQLPQYPGDGRILQGLHRQSEDIQSQRTIRRGNNVQLSLQIIHEALKSSTILLNRGSELQNDAPDGRGLSASTTRSAASSYSDVGSVRTGGRKSIVGMSPASAPRFASSSIMSSCRGWPRVSRYIVSAFRNRSYFTASRLSRY